MSIKQKLVGLATVLIFGIVALFIVVPVLSQGPALPPGEYDLESGQYVFNVPELQDTPVAPTDTPVPPTDTPEPSHDRTAWHPVSADVSHTHFSNPDEVAHIFGPILDFLPQSISYSWETTNENLNKHEGYKWGVAEHTECIQRESYVGQNCIMAWRIEHHSVGGPLGQQTRFHSGYGELLICTPNQQDCGILRIGIPLVDYGCLRSNRPIHREHIPLPADDDGLEDCADKVVDGLYHGSPYRDTIDNGLVPLVNGRVGSAWNSEGGEQGSVSWAFLVHDDWQGTVRNDPLTLDFANFVCPDFQCEYNHSTEGFYRVIVKNGWLRQFVVDGFANFNGTIDAEGNPNPGCTLGPDCAPLILENVPAGTANFTRSTTITPLEEFDLSPPGEFWIEYPN